MSEGYTTGYVIPAEALRRYLVDGAGLTWLVERSYTPQPPVEGQPSMEWVARWELFHDCLDAFRDIRDAAQPEIRAKVEIISSFMVEDEATDRTKDIYYVQTGAFKQYQRWARNTPNELDVIGITTFIEAANAMLPDDDARLRAGFKLEDMEFEVLSKSCIRPPFYREDERKEVQALRMSLLSQYLRTLKAAGASQVDVQDQQA
ncbi:hypothetical protein C8Q74DRAFT_1373538 [Fomes fomentarius]|nr:hypothetical protein C8Q74DRAFT_1373538 [Fomes fomentarius]